MDEQIIFTTNNTGSVGGLHSFEQATLRQCTVNSKHSAVQVGSKYLFVAQAQKALINVYNLSGPHKRESIEQRLPLPEVLNCLEVVENRGIERAYGNGHRHKLADFNLPYLLLGSTTSGKLYIWELNSGILLGVKPMAHYQSITKIKSVVNGKYVITSGNDARLIIWQTMDLVSVDEPKPICIVHDHTLPITDFQISATYGDFLSSSGTKLFTASEDATLKCYDLNLMARNDKKDLAKPSLLTTFSLPYPITSLVLDPADRACYIGTQQGCFNLQLFYKLSETKIANLVQSSGDRNGEKGRIFSLVERLSGQQSGQDKDKLYSMAQLLCDKVIEVDVTCLEISMDGTLLLVGDSEGKVSVTEIYSKQILRTMQPLSTSQSSHGSVTNILVDTLSTVTNGQINGQQYAKASLNTSQKIPSLQRVIYDKNKPGQLHDIWHQVGAEEDNGLLPLSDFGSYLDNVKSQQTAFTQQGEVSSKIKIVGVDDSNDDIKMGGTNESGKDKEIAELQESVETLKQAYKELRDMHEKLFEEHEKLLAN